MKPGVYVSRDGLKLYFYNGSRYVEGPDSGLGKIYQTKYQALARLKGAVYIGEF